MSDANFSVEMVEYLKGDGGVIISTLNKFESHSKSND